MDDEMIFNPSVGTWWTACPQLTDDNHELLDKMLLNVQGIKLILLL